MANSALGTNAAFDHFDGPLDCLSFPSDAFDVALVLWKLDNVKDIDASLKEVARVVKKDSAGQILVIQGAPDNEFVQFINNTPPLPTINHQGRVLADAMDILARVGFADNNLTRINGSYIFPEESIAKRCKSAAKLLIAGNLVDEEVTSSRGWNCTSRAVNTRLMPK